MKLWIWFVVFLSSVQLSAQEQASDLLKIKKLLAPYGEKASISLRNLNGESLLEINSKGLFTPASTAKVVSSACTLDALGPDFSFETPWGYRGEVKDGILYGDLVVRGRGDFSFVIEDLKMITEYIRNVHQIKEIKGKLIIDSSYFTSTKLNFDGFEGDRGRAFQAPLTVLPINHNAFSIWVVPELPKPRIEIVPAGSVELDIQNKLTLTNGRLGGSKSVLDFRPESLKLIMSGSVGRSDPIKIYYRSVPDPYDAFARLFQYNFEKLGGKWKRAFEVKSSSGPMTSLWIHRSRSISRLLIDVNKLSTNFGAEMALLAAASQSLGGAVDAKKSADYLRSCIQRMGFTPAQLNLDNASGLSRSSKLQPEALSAFLATISEKGYFPEFLSSLSVLGQDGTTRSRLKTLSGRARLKTGTLSGVHSLAGYVFPSRQMPKTMALILNCNTCDMGKWQRIEDEILEILIQGS